MTKPMGLSKEERLAQLNARISAQPTLTDGELAGEFGVSIHTIRADRQKLGIPEARQRARDVAENLYGKAKSLSDQEIIGELLEIEPDRAGLSLLEASPETGFRHSTIVRGHVLFAQANSLAAAVVDADVALTGEARVSFVSPVRVGERILAKARVIKTEGRKRTVELVLKTKEQVVFRGEFLMYGLARDVAEHLHIMSDL